MRPDDFEQGFPGRFVRVTGRGGKAGWAFIPDDLPPDDDFVDLEIASAAERAGIALGNLNGSGRMLRNPTLLLQPFMRREALASSRIEGTRAEFDQLILFEAADPGTPQDPDIQEVTNYLHTVYSGWQRPRERPFSTGFIMELHQQLMDGVRGSTKGPGVLRPNQVMIGSGGDDISNARFVPPPPEEVRELLERLCDYIVAPSKLPALVRLALIHYQFEAIHPFQDGNGRLGRILMPLILGEWQMLDLPLLYLSEYFEDHRSEYVDALYAVSQRGAWKEWVLFTLLAIEHQSCDAMIRSQYLLTLREDLREKYQAGKSTNTLRIVDLLFEMPAVTISRAATYLDITNPAASRIVGQLVEDGVLEEVTGFRRNRIFVARGIVAAMTQRPSEERQDQD